MTHNGTNSLEIVVVLTNDDAVMSYVNEWACLLTISEKTRLERRLGTEFSEIWNIIKYIRSQNSR